MWAGLFWSRALLSVSTALYLAYALFVSGKEGWEEVKRSWWLKGMVLLFLLPLISGFWSEDKQEWLKIIVDKLPFLFFPFTVPAFRGLFKGWSGKLVFVLGGFVVLSILYSIRMLLSITDISSVYLKAKVAPVWMMGDHVRYSLLLLISLAWIIQVCIIDDSMRRFRWAGLLIVVCIAVFIHILSTKTGLFGFYLMTILFIVHQFKGRKRTFITASVCLLPVIAWFLIPSFQSKLRLVIWDFQHYSRGGYVEGLSDTPRVLSWQGGLDIWKKHFITGVGSGDVGSTIVEWYSDHAPYLKAYEQLLPSNEFLIYACSGGVLSALFVLVFLMLPFIQKKGRSFLWTSFHLLFLMISLYEISWETQFGVFLYSFFGVLFFTMSSPYHRSSISSKAK